jgi:DNA-binding transcriptional regulator YiaG
MPKDVSVTDILKKWRGSRLQKEAASILGVSVRTYQNWENGVNVPTHFCVECIKEKVARGN